MEKRFGLEKDNPDTSPPRYSGAKSELRSKSGLSVNTVRVLGVANPLGSGSEKANNAEAKTKKAASGEGIMVFSSKFNAQL